jgi:hypothetical protein
LDIASVVITCIPGGSGGWEGMVEINEAIIVACDGNCFLIE